MRWHDVGFDSWYFYVRLLLVRNRWKGGYNGEQEGMEQSDEMEGVNVLSVEKLVKWREVTGGELGVKGPRSDSDLGPTGKTCL